MTIAKPKNIIIFALIVFATYFSSCKKNEDVKDEELTIVKRNFTGNQLRLDGFYHTIYDNKIHKIFFFYRNGVVSDHGSYNTSNFSEVESGIKANDYKTKNARWWWGVFVVDSNIINMEKWYPSSASFEGRAPFPVYKSSGTILNDSTFVFQKQVHSHGPESRVVNDTYHFRKTDFKPDSTNKYIP